MTTFDRALEVWQAFGPERGRPVKQRWAESVPDLAPADYEQMAARCTAAQSAADDLANDVRGEKLSFESACTRLGSRFPDLSAERCSRTLNQAMYFTYK